MSMKQGNRPNWDATSTPGRHPAFAVVGSKLDCYSDIVSHFVDTANVHFGPTIMSVACWCCGRALDLRLTGPLSRNIGGVALVNKTFRASRAAVQVKRIIFTRATLC